MRQLTIRQKKLLDMAMASDSEIRDVEDLSPAVWEGLRKINDTEILWQEANRYISDMRWKRINNK